MSLGNADNGGVFKPNAFHFDDDEGFTVKEVAKLSFKGKVLQQQWVTLTASMWPEPTASPRGWKVSSDRLPLLAAVFCGAALVVCLVCAFVLYRCCIMQRKHFGVRKLDQNSPGPLAHPKLQVPTQTAIYAEQKASSWGYNNRLVNPFPGGPWCIPRNRDGQCTDCSGLCPVPRSTSNPETDVRPGQKQSSESSRKKQSVSQPIQLGASNLITNESKMAPKQLAIPEICEYSPYGAQYASSSASVLTDVNQRDDEQTSEPTLKTRSLPAWVRSKSRPLSTEDDLNDLYAKVNFSKKRKNRMRNDEAAIIALSKSRSQFFYKDTDSLVDNEAVIVYDERTAL